MKIGIYGNKAQKMDPYLHYLIDELVKYKTEIIVYEPLYKRLLQNTKYAHIVTGTFYTHDDIDKTIDYVVSLGGDGTFLETVTLIRDKSIPIIGINTGRLGFLANISKDNIKQAISEIANNDYTKETRSLIKIEQPKGLFDDFPYGLNEVTIQKKDSAMITINVEMDGQFLNSYWADGLIISTPTGSTAYSLSAGGPVLAPQNNNFIISPIAPHNLTVRPLVIPNNCELTLKVNARNNKCLITTDSRAAVTNIDQDFILKTAEFEINVVKLCEHTFFDTLRNKLMWGADIRN
jgi:NAD+ kinase